MAETGDTSIESLANNAIAAGCLQAVMSLVHPELAKFVSFQRERVGKTDAEQNKRSSSSSSRHSRRRSDAPEPSDGGGSRSQNQQMDLSYQLKYLRQHWHSHLRYYGLDPELPAVVQRALMYRNKVSHQSQMNLDQYQVAIATFQKLAELIECNALIRQQIKELVAKLLSFSPLSTHQTTPEDEENEVRTREKEYQESVKPLVATAEQMQQYNFFNDEDEEPLWVELKLIGNDYFKERNYSEAVEAYSQALEAAPHEAVLYGNRSMCHLRLKEYDLAREDAEDAMDEDGGDNIKYYRLLSEALMGLKEYREAKEICDQGLELDPKDEVLLSRRDKAESMAEIERLRSEQEKKKREQEERAKLAAANAATATLAQEQTEGETAKQKKKSKKNKVKLKKTAPDLELAPMINYQEVSTKLIEVHTRGSKQLEVYSQGMQYMVIAAEALVQVTDSIGEPGRSRLPLDELVSEGIANLHKAGEAGVAEAWFRLGVLYSSTLRKGIPLNPDPHKTICYLNKAAACRPFIKPPGNRVFPHHGVAEAENELGVCYRDGKPAPVVEADPEKAFQFFLSSAEHDFPMGQYNVSVAYTIGFGTAADAFAARLWASRAAQHGLPEGQQHLAELLEKGVGGKRDAKQAREWSLIASQSRLTDLVLKHDFADVGVTPINNGEISEMFARNPNVMKHGKEEFREFYGMYLDDDEFGQKTGSGFNDDDVKITKVSSYKPSATSSSDQLGANGIYRPPSAVINAEIQVRAEAGGHVASNYLASEKLLSRAESFFNAGEVANGLRDMKAADLLWERPICVFTASSKYANLLSKAVKEANLSFQLNPRDPDAAYVVGRWELMSNQDVVLHWKQCVKMHPNEASFHFYLGAAYLTIRHREDAMAAMEAALAIERKADWLYWLAVHMIEMGLVDAATTVYEEYVSTNPPDERFVPDAYYALGALYFKKYDTAKAVIYHELGQMAESVATRFPAFHPRVHVHIPKETLRSSMKMHGYMESSVIANVIAQNMAECGFCKCRIKPTQLLNHKMSKCPRRIIVCQVCSVDMVFDDLHAHKQFCVSTNQNTQPSPNGVSKQTTASKNDNAQPNLKKSAGAQVLTKPNCHFAGTILEISQGKSATKPTVFTLQTVVGQRWTLRLNRASQLVTESTVAAETLKALNGAVAQNTLLVFWRTSPSLDMIDRRALTVPMGNDVYGQDVIIYVLQCSVQTLSFELRELRNNMHIKKGPLCSSCNCSPLAGGNLSTCGACKVVKYCSRECQRIHWKRVHRYMCQDPVLLGNCNSLSEDITPYERSVPAKKEDAATYKMYKAAKKGRSDSVDHGSMLGILEDIVETVRSSGDGIDPNVNEHYMLPSCNPLRPDKIQGSVRVFKQAAPSKSGKKEFIVQFSIGYLASLPTPAQQQELHYFFQIPPHNPMQLKHGGMEVYLEDCKALTDDASGSGFRMMMEVPLAKFPVPALAELLDYLRTNTNMYLS